MENTTIVLVKLLSGDNLICETENDYEYFLDKRSITIVNPVILNILRMPRGDKLLESYVMMPWFGFAKFETYTIPTNKIITIMEVQESIKDNYFEFVENRKAELYENSNEETAENIEDSFFQNNTGEDERDIESFLENVIEKLGEQIEEDEESEGRDSFILGRFKRGTRTLH